MRPDEVSIATTSPSSAPSRSAVAVLISAQLCQAILVTLSGTSWFHGSAAPRPSHTTMVTSASVARAWNGGFDR